MESLSFFCSVTYQDRSSSLSDDFVECVDSYFYLGGRQFRVIPNHAQQGGEGGIYIEGECSMISSALKIISYCTVVIPLLMVVVKGILRSVYTFHVIDQEPSAKKIQSMFRLYAQRRSFERQRRIQRVLRARTRLNRAACVIQGTFRMNRVRRDYLGKRAAAQVIQSGVRMFLAKREKMRRAVRVEEVKIPIQKAFDQLKVSEAQVQAGYGEYVVFSLDPGFEITEEVFAQAHGVISELKTLPLEGGQIRGLMIQEAINGIDTHCKVAFIPRTLFELEFIRAGIEEEMKAKKICQLNYRRTHEWIRREGEKGVELPSCWHPLSAERHEVFASHPQLPHLAFRFNRHLCERFKPQGFFLGKQLVMKMEDIIHYFQHHSRVFPEKFMREKIKWRMGVSGTSLHFGMHREQLGRVTALPMGIVSRSDAQLVRNALALECGEEAQNGYILYRGGAQFRMFEGQEKVNFSVCYGMSLFAGALYEPDATVAYYGKQKKRSVHAITIPFMQARDPACPYFIPRETNALYQLAVSQSEFWHARTKVPKGTEGHIRGVCGGQKQIAEFPDFYVACSSEELVGRISALAQRMVLLKHSEREQLRVDEYVCGQERGAPASLVG